MLLFLFWVKTPVVAEFSNAQILFILETTFPRKIKVRMSWILLFQNVEIGNVIFCELAITL